MYRGFVPTDYVAGGKTMTAEIGGRDRHKFFKRPVVPAIAGSTQTLGQVPLAFAANRPTIHRTLQARSQVLQTEAQGSLVMNQKAKPLEHIGQSSAARSAGRAMMDNVGAEAAAPSTNASGAEVREMSCQTMMRENDCQTDPYTRDYILVDGHQPEVLAIMELRYGEGLPAGLGEVEMIDRVQRRKKVEAELPQGNDPKAMNKRLAALETLERAEWDERENHIKALQEGRLEQIGDALQRREAKREDASKDRVEKLKRAKLGDVERQLQKLQEKRLVATRKLTTKHSNPCCEKSVRDIVSMHATHGAKGKSVVSSTLVEKINTSNYDVRPTLLSFPEGVQELEKTKVPQLEAVNEDKMKPPVEKAISKLATNFQKRQARQVTDDLEYANKTIEQDHKETQKQQSVQDLYRATPRLQRPDTPTLMLVGDEDEEREEAMLLLQRLLRGRAVQNDFFEGKERCHGLIEELQAASNAKGHEDWWQDEKKKEQVAARQEEAVQSVVDEAQGDVVFGTLDYLFKELLRQQEASRVDALRMRAEETREVRETAERNKRAEEQRLRQRDERQYAQLVRSTDATVETYLDQVLLATVRSTAATQALQEQVRPEAPVALATDMDKENYVCDLLDSFVIPLVCERADGKSEKERTKALAEAASAGALSMLDNL